jgi:hypothetical protein
MFTCDIGDVPRIKVVFTDDAGAVVDPTTIVLYLKPPTGAVGTYTYAAGDVTRQAAGTYYYQGTVTQAGYYNTRWIGAGAAVAAEQSRFFARGSNT